MINEGEHIMFFSDFYFCESSLTVKDINLRSILFVANTFLGCGLPLILFMNS